jgi:hypothetical protein
MPTKNIFISYSKEDREAATRICAHLEGRGIGCWIAPRDVPPGATWDVALLEAIAGAEAVLLVLSGNANKSKYVQSEVNRAFDKGKTVFVLRIENVLPAKALELYLSRRQWTDAFEPPLEKNVDRLVDSIRALLRSAADPDAAASAADRHVGASACEPPGVVPPPIVGGIGEQLKEESRDLNDGSPSFLARLPRPLRSKRVVVAGITAFVLVCGALAMSFFRGKYTGSEVYLPLRASGQLVQGLNMDVWSMGEGSLDKIPSEPSLGSVMVTRDSFRYASFTSEQTLAGYRGKAVGVRWSGYLKIPKNGEYLLVCEPAYMPGLHPYSSHFRVELGGEVVFEDVRSGWAAETRLLNKTVRFQPGFYRLQVWIAAKDSHDPKLMESPEAIAGTLKVRCPGATTAEPATKEMLYCLPPATSRKK